MVILPAASTSSQPLASATCSKVCWVNASPAAVAPAKPARPGLFSVRAAFSMAS